MHCSRVPRKPPPHLSVEQLSLLVGVGHPTAVLLCPSHEVGHHFSYRAVRDNLVCLIPAGTQRVCEVVTHPKQLAKGYWTGRLGDTKVPHPVHTDGWRDRYMQVKLNVYTPTPYTYYACVCIHTHQAKRQNTVQHTHTHRSQGY